MTLWPFQHVVCHTLPYTRLFVAPRCSVAFCVWVLSAAALVLVPLFATFATDNVWVKESFYRLQPSVTFADELFVVVGGSTPENTVGWSTQPDLQTLLPEQVKIPIVRATAQDNNRDGIADTVRLKLDFPLQGEAFRTVLVLGVYDVQLQGKVSERLSGLVALDLASPYLASGVWVHGQLSIRQKLPLFQSAEVRTEYANSPLAVNWRSNWVPQNQPLSLQALLARYAQRNETAIFEPLVPPLWDYTPKQSFHIEVTMDIPPQLVYYVPLAAEVLKLAWVQVLAFLIPTWILLEWLKGLVFDQRLVESFVVPTLPPMEK
mmetsp:Transcript_18440/g.43142  ORF Transcript_18440/g.43142 Transcript_18440/m.43142 type:complete len:319 (+) Transcript_18440:80-1036(+)